MRAEVSIPTLGIIGGAGPMAGSLLFQTVIQLAQQKYGCRRDADFPFLMLLNFPFADMLQGQQTVAQAQVIRTQLQHCFTMLSAHGIKAVAIACNTLHAFLDPQMTQGIPAFVHMAAETANRVEQCRVNRVLTVCSGTSIRHQLHRKFFDCLYPELQTQSLLDQLIQRILAGKYGPEDAKELASCIRRSSPDGVVLGCTELSLLESQFPLHQHGLPMSTCVIDPNQIVAEKLCDLSLKELL